MSDRLMYNPKKTRELYCAVAKMKGRDLEHLIELVNLMGGVIGNADLKDMEIRDAKYFICARHHLANNTPVYERALKNKKRLSHDWDRDGVWMPTPEEKK